MVYSNVQVLESVSTHWKSSRHHRPISLNLKLNSVTIIKYLFILLSKHLTWGYTSWGGHTPSHTRHGISCSTTHPWQSSRPFHQTSSTSTSRETFSSMHGYVLPKPQLQVRYICCRVDRDLKKTSASLWMLQAKKREKTERSNRMIYCPNKKKKKTVYKVHLWLSIALNS